MGKLRQRVGLIAAIQLFGLANAPAPAPVPKPELIEVKQTAPVVQRATAAPCNGTAKDRSSELCAAWHSADASADAAYWSKVSAIIGLIGSIGVVITILIARQTLKASVNAERPHVRFYRTIKTTGNKGQIITVSGINFRNYGRTPALVKSLSLDYKLCSSPPLPSTAVMYRKWPDDSVMPQDEEWPRKHHIPPLDKSVDLNLLISKHDPKGLRLFVFGELRYADAFGVIHFTRFCRQWDGRNFTYAENGEDEDYNASN